MRINFAGKRNLPLMFAALLFALHVRADSYLLSEEAFFSEIPVVETATRLEQKITDAPVAVSIIDREMIRASGATEIPELLNLIPGFASYYVHGSILGVTNRGLATDFPGDLEITLDGRSIYEPLFSAVEWISQYITLDDIAYIEVVRGSNVPTSGSNAFLGAVNIVTRSSLEDSSTRVTATVGDIDTRRATLRKNMLVGDMQLRFGLTYRHDRGFPQIPTHFNRDGNESLGSAIDGLYSFNVNNRIEFAIGYVHGRIEDPDTDAVNDLVDRDFDNQYQQVAWVRDDDTMHMRAQFYHNRLTIQETANFGLISELFEVSPSVIPFVYPGQTDEYVTTDEKNFGERYDVEFEQSFPLFSNSQWVWGIGARLDRIRSPAFLDRRDTIDTEDYRLFANLEHKIARLTLNAGFMLNHNDLVQESLSRRLGLSYAFNASHHLRAAVTTAYRTPSLLEENQQLVLRFEDGTLITDLLLSEGDLKSTKVEEYDIAYKAFWYDGAIDIEMRKFKRQLDNVVDSRREVDFFSLVRIRNDDNYLEQNGFDMIVSAKSDEFGRFSINYARTHFDYDKLFDGIGTRIKNREGYPEYQYGAQWSKRWFDVFESSATYRYMPETNWLDGDRIERFARLDVRLAWTLDHDNNKYTVELLGQNLGDDYAVYDTQNVFERRLFLRVGASLF